MATEEQPSYAERRLYRSESDRYIAGVAGGLAEYLQVDPTIVRIAFLILAFWGAGVVLYLIMWLIVPTRGQASGVQSVEQTVRSNAHEIRDRAEAIGDQVRGSIPQGARQRNWGIILMLLGLGFLLSNFGLLHFISFDRIWPILLIAIGFLMLARR
jgi:phage shock protein C